MVMDLKEEWSARVGEDQRRSPSTTSQQRQPNNEPKKFCTDCHTTTTPLWRGGPAGPKSLCNACGIKYRKKRRALLGLEKGRTEKTKKKSKNMINGTSSSNSNSVGSNCNINNNGVEEQGARGSKKASNGGKMLALGEGMLLKKLNGSAGDQKKLLPHRGKLGEEEQAAILLMALSCGSVSA